MAHITLRKIMALAALATALYGTPALAEGGYSTMRETVANTLKNNPNIKAFQEYRQAAEYDVKRARSGWFPKVDARAGYGFDQWNDASTRGANSKQDKYTFYDRTELSATISQTIWDGMATWNRVQMGLNKLDSAESRLFDNAEALGLDAVLAHIEIYRQRRIVALAELNVKNHKAILNSQMERQRSGASTMADVTQIQTRLARTQASLAESRSALEVALANYKRLTGIDAGEVEVPAQSPDFFNSLETAMSHSQTLNHKIRAVRSDALAADAQADLDKSPFHPQIFIEAGPSYRWRVESSDTYSWGNAIMLRANWNLFNGGYDWYNVKGSKARARQARHDISVLLDNLAQETAATWSQIVSAQEQANYYANAVEFSTKTRDMYLEQFNVGQRSLLDVLDAENELFSSSIQLVTAQQNIIAGNYRLLALGGKFLPAFGLNAADLAVKADTYPAKSTTTYQPIPLRNENRQTDMLMSSQPLPPLPDDPAAPGQVLTAPDQQVSPSM